MPVWVAAKICRKPFSPSAASALRSSSSTALNGCFVFHSGCFGGQRLDPIDREHDLEIHRLLGPQRAVVVEGGDALVERHEIRAALGRDARDEIGDRLLHRAVIPGRQRIGWRLRMGAGKPAGRHSKAEEREQGRSGSIAMSGDAWISGFASSRIGYRAFTDAGRNAGRSSGSSRRESGRRRILPSAPVFLDALDRAFHDVRRVEARRERARRKLLECRHELEDLVHHPYDCCRHD